MYELSIGAVRRLAMSPKDGVDWISMFDFHARGWWKGRKKKRDTGAKHQANHPMSSYRLMEKYT